MELGIQVASAVMAVFVPTATVVAAAQVHESQMSKHYTDKKIAKKDLEPGDHIFVKICPGSSQSGSSRSGSLRSGSTGSGSTGSGSTGSGSTGSGSTGSGSTGSEFLRSGSTGSGSTGSGSTGSGSTGSEFLRSGSSGSGSTGSEFLRSGSSGSGSSGSEFLRSGSTGSGSTGSGSTGSGSTGSEFLRSGSTGSGSTGSVSPRSGSSGSESLRSGSSQSGSCGSDSIRNIISAITYHHGIYLGDEEVTDFGSVNRTHPVIRPLVDFLQSREDCIYRREYVKTARTSDKTVQLARVLCRSAQEMADIDFYDYEPYHFTKNNCEHYATRLKTEKHWSGQVERAQIWNLPSARERYQNCNRQDVAGSSWTPSSSSSSVRGTSQAATEHAGHLIA